MSAATRPGVLLADAMRRIDIAIADMTFRRPIRRDDMHSSIVSDRKGRHPNDRARTE